MTQSIKKYTGTAKFLHWFIGLLVIMLLIFGFGLENLPVSERQEMIMGHAGLGTIILLLMLFRLYWRSTHQPPAPVSSMSSKQIKASMWMQRLLYGLLLLQPIFGISQAAFVDYEVAAFGSIEYSALAANDASLAQLFHALHGLTAMLLILLVIGHTVLALVHHFYNKDDSLKRILPFGKVD